MAENLRHTMNPATATVPVWAMFLTTLSAGEQARTSGLGPEMISQGNHAPTAEAASDEAFVARRAKSQMNMPAPQRLPQKPGAFGLMEMSTAIQSGADFILIPKGAVLFCPPELDSKVVARPTGKIVDWLQFLRTNRSWVTTFEVTEDQITGKTPVPAGSFDRFRKNKQLVISTFQGGPVTVVRSSPP